MPKHFVCIDSKDNSYSFYEGNKHIITVIGYMSPEWLEKYRRNYAQLLADVVPPPAPEAA